MVAKSLLVEGCDVLEPANGIVNAVSGLARLCQKHVSDLLCSGSLWAVNRYGAGWKSSLFLNLAFGIETQVGVLK